MIRRVCGLVFRRPRGRRPVGLWVVRLFLGGRSRILCGFLPGLGRGGGGVSKHVLKFHEGCVGGGSVRGGYCVRICLGTKKIR